jgi:hypothetical protein
MGLLACVRRMRLQALQMDVLDQALTGAVIAFRLLQLPSKHVRRWTNRFRAYLSRWACRSRFAFRSGRLGETSGASTSCIAVICLIMYLHRRRTMSEIASVKSSSSRETWFVDRLRKKSSTSSSSARQNEQRFSSNTEHTQRGQVAPVRDVVDGVDARMQPGCEAWTGEPLLVIGAGVGSVARAGAWQLRPAKAKGGVVFVQLQK